MALIKTSARVLDDIPIFRIIKVKNTFGVMSGVGFYKHYYVSTTATVVGYPYSRQKKEHRPPPLLAGFDNFLEVISAEVIFLDL